MSRIDPDLSPSRRNFLYGGGAGVLGLIVASLLGGTGTRVYAKSLDKIPTVDRLAVRVVTDSFHLAIAPDAKFGNVTVRRLGMPAAGRSLLGEFGLALHAESQAGDATRSILVDFGFTAETLNNSSDCRIIGN